MDDKITISLNDLRMCDNCGNVFSKNLKNEPINRCPACSVWKK